MSPKTNDQILRQARARAALQHKDPRQPPHIEVAFVGTIGTPQIDRYSRSVPNYDFTSAEICNVIPGEAVKTFTRGENETLDAFKARVRGELPGVSDRPWIAIFYSPNIPAAPIPASLQ